MINNPIRNLHTDYVTDDVLKTIDVNTLVQSVPFDFVITKERVDEYREIHGYTQSDWMDVGQLFWEGTLDVDYTCGGRSSINILINFHTTIEDRFYFGGRFQMIAPIQAHVYSLSSYRAGGCSCVLYHHTHGSEDYVLFEETGGIPGTFFRNCALYVGSFKLQPNGTTYPVWHAGSGNAPFVYERCLDGILPQGGSGEPNVIVKRELWMSNGGSGGSGTGGHIRVIDTNLTGIHCEDVSGGGISVMTITTVINDEYSTESIRLTQDVKVVQDGVGPKSITDIYPTSTYGATDPWFDGAYPSQSDYPKVPRALDVGDAEIIDVYTWSVFFGNPSGNGNANMRYENPHGQRIAYYTTTVSNKPFHILADSLVEDRVYELRVHLMQYVGLIATDSNVPGMPYPVFKIYSKEASNVIFDKYTFFTAPTGGASEDDPHRSGEPANFLVSFIPTQQSSSQSTDKLPIARWLYTSTDNKSTGSTVLTMRYTYNLLNNRMEYNKPAPEMGIAKALFFKHNGYIYTLTY